MTVHIKEDIFRLDVPIYYIFAVQIFYPKQYFCEVKPSLFLAELLQLIQMEENFSSSAQIHDEE